MKWGARGVIATNMSARISVQVQVTTSVAVHPSLATTGPKSRWPTTATRSRNRDRLCHPPSSSRATKWDRSVVFYLPSFSLHAIIDLTPHRPATPRSACTNNSERLFFTCLFPPWASKRPKLRRVLLPFPNVILALTETTSKEIRMLKAPQCFFSLHLSDSTCVV
jgi:hypothetical protein